MNFSRKSFKKIILLTSAFLLLITQSAHSVEVKGISKVSFARGTSAISGWTFEYPDFSTALTTDMWNFELKATSGNAIDMNDSADLQLLDATGKEILTSFGYASQNNGSIKFEEYFTASDLVGIDISKAFKATISVKRTYLSKYKDATLTFSIPTSAFPKKPSTAAEYVALNTTFTSIPYPKSCSPVEFQYTVIDPYQEVSTVKFAVIDTGGKEIDYTTAYNFVSGLQKSELQICPSSLSSTVGPYTFVTTISFGSLTGKIALTSSIPFPITTLKDETAALATKLGDYCLKGTASKIVASGANCPSGYKKVVFTSPNEVTWNSLIRMPNSQKGKNFLIYGCVAQFDSNTGGSKFRAYASPTQQEYYWSNGANSIFTGSSKELLKLSEKSAFLAKVTVTGGVSYTTIGGKTSVPSFAINQFQVIGKC